MTASEPSILPKEALTENLKIGTRESNCRNLVDKVVNIPQLLVQSDGKSFSRSSHQSCPIKKGVLRNFAKFTGKHLCQSLFLNKIAGQRPATLLKKKTLAQVFSREFWEISKNTFFTEHLRTTAYSSC